MCAECGQENPAGGAFCGRCGKPQAAAGDEKPLPGVTLGALLGKRYRLDAKLGEGGMGVVYAAHDVELDRPVAVKVLARSMTESPDVVERFEREARLTAKLEHPNVVPVYDVGRDDGRPFLVMKRLEGDTLAARLREKGGLTRDETLQLFKQLAQGIDFIHEKGFIHRDIKAHNIMVGPQGQATLLDFGILRSQRGNDALTRTGVVMGTPHYMAPELALGLTDVDHRVDLYALAVVLFECLTGTLPFEADSELGLIQLQAHAPPPDLIHRAPWIPPPVAEVVSRALSKRPLDRFPSAASLVQALEQAFAQAPVDPQAHAAPGAQAPVVPASTAPSWRAKAKDVVVAARPVEPVAAPAAPVPPAASAPVASTQATVDLAAVAVRRSRWPLVVVAGAVAVLALVAVAWPRPNAAPVPLATPLTIADAGLARTEVDAGAPGAPADADAGALAVAAPVDAGASAQGAGGITVKPMRGRGGQVRIVSTLAGEPWWTQVYVDGAPRGRTPLVVMLPPGRHRIRMERSGFTPQEQEILLGRGAALAVRFELQR